MTDDRGPHAEPVAGYRLVRLLGENERAEVYLGVGMAESRENVEPREPRAIKIYRPFTPESSIREEIAALERAAGDHVVPLLDVARAPSGRLCLVLERVSGAQLSALVDQRGSIAPGEAVTVLAPLIETIARLHECGVAHGGVRPANVVFSSDGAPMLVGFGGAVILDRHDATGAGEPRVADKRALAALVTWTLGATVPHADVRRALDGVVALDPMSSDWFDALSALVFEIAEPLPVLSVSDALQRRPSMTEAAFATTARLRAPAEGTAAAAEATGSVARSSRDRVGTLIASVRSATTRARQAIRAVRRRFWLVAATAVIGVVGITALGSTAFEPATSKFQSDSVGLSDPAVADTSPTAPPDESARDESSMVGDDPTAALPVLLALRARCLRELSILCLDDVDQPGSASMRLDREFIQHSQSGDVAGRAAPDLLAIEERDIHIVERLGAAALLAVGTGGGEGATVNSEPTSVLLVKGEAGWRLREVLPPPVSDGLAN